MRLFNHRILTLLYHKRTRTSCAEHVFCKFPTGEVRKVWVNYSLAVDDISALVNEWIVPEDSNGQGTVQIDRDLPMHDTRNSRIEMEIKSTR